MPDAATAPHVSFARSVTAASKRIDVTNAEDVKLAVRAAERWVPEAWTYHDEVPEVKYVSRFAGNCMSRLRYFPAVIVNPDEAPVPVQDAIGGDGISAALAAAALDEMDRLNGADGQASLNREWGVNLSISGDSYLVGEEVDGEEAWQVYSESAVVKVEGGLGLRDRPGAKPRKLGDDVLVLRIWRRHSRWPGLADSNMRAVLSECEELLIYSRQFRAVGKSRNNAGILFLHNKLDVPTPADANARDGLTKLERDFMRSMITPVGDDSSASAVVPHIIRGDGKPDELIKHFPLDRKIDEKAIERVNFLVGRLAHGLDMPVEVLTGQADVNHWTAWQIEDSTYKAHIEPLAMIPAVGLAKDLLRPALLERGFGVDEVRRIVVAVDPSALVVRPNRGQDAKDAFDKGAISYEALLRYLGFPESDLPTPEERLLRYVFERGIGAAGLTRDVMRIIGFEEVPSQAEAIEAETAAEVEAQGELPAVGNDDDQPIPATDENEGQARRLAAVDRLLGDDARRRELASPMGRVLQFTRALTAASGQAPLGERLSSIDQRLRDRLQVAASAALTNALRVAGQRLKARAQGDDAAAARVRNVAPADVPATLGEADAFSLADLDTLLDGVFDDLASTWATAVAAAQAEVAAVLRASTDDADAATRAVDEFEATQDDDRDAGWLLLLVGLRSLARGRMFTPDGTPDDGEFDPTVSVPAGEVRAALARAGGAVEPAAAPVGSAQVAAGEGVTGGVATGPRAVRALTRINQQIAAWEWRVGFPSVPFPPHQALAGVRFTDWTDDRLVNGGGFPAYGHLFPGDHKGCQCDAVPVIVPADEL